MSENEAHLEFMEAVKSGKPGSVIPIPDGITLRQIQKWSITRMDEATVMGAKTDLMKQCLKDAAEIMDEFVRGRFALRSKLWETAPTDHEMQKWLRETSANDSDITKVEVALFVWESEGCDM